MRNTSDEKDTDRTDEIRDITYNNTSSNNSRFTVFLVFTVHRLVKYGIMEFKNIYLG